MKIKDKRNGMWWNKGKSNKISSRLWVRLFDECDIYNCFETWIRSTSSTENQSRVGPILFKNWFKITWLIENH